MLCWTYVRIESTILQTSHIFAGTLFFNHHISSRLILQCHIRNRLHLNIDHHHYVNSIWILKILKIVSDCNEKLIKMNVINNEIRECSKENKSKADFISGERLTLDELIQKLHDAFKTNLVDIDYVQSLMASYESNPQDWKKYAKFDRHRYTRNLVDEGNGKFNLMVLCWGEGHGSAIHDHADAHCVMKILQGELCETRYAWPNTQCESYHEGKELREIGRNTLYSNGVYYINDTMGLHRVENLSTVNPAVSLHLYSPPFSQCSVFNKQTGQRTFCKVTFWSKYGEHRNHEIQRNRCPEDN